MNIMTGSIIKLLRYLFLFSWLMTRKTAAETNTYDAILFRTHMLDQMTLQKLIEIRDDCDVLNAKLLNRVHLSKVTKYHDEVSMNVGGNDQSTSLRAVQYELNIIYDQDTVPDFENQLLMNGFNTSENVRLTGLTLDAFTYYPNVKPVALSKSYYQHLAWTSWWRVNHKRKNWRFIWCLEHDVGVSGGYWRHVFDHHLEPPHSSRDFISWRVGWTPRPDKVHTKGDKQWNILMRYGPLLEKKQIPDNEVALHFGPLTRFSTKYLSYVEKQSLKGNTGHSEIVLTTLCNITKWCSMGNLSVAIMGGRDGNLFAYKNARDINTNVFHALSLLRPGKLFHPVRDVDTVSDTTHIAKAGMESNGFELTKRNIGLKSIPESDRLSMYFAQCLLRNVRPPYPSYSCPIGCPWHHQVTCPTVNCMARQNGTYLHMAVIDCVRYCKQTRKCPWTTSTVELKAIAERREGFVPNMLEDTILPSVAGPP